MELTLWALFLGTSLATTLSPGPNTLLVMTHATKYGRRASLLTIAANLCSQFIFMLLVIYGFGAFLAQTPMLYFVMKTAGACYLIYLGVKTLIEAGKSSAVTLTQSAGVTPPRSAVSRFVEAFLVSCSNPKTVLFLSALLPQFLDVNGNLIQQFAIMYITNAIVILTIHALYGHIALSVKERVLSANVRKRFSQLSGITFVSLGFGLLTSRNPS